MEGCVLLMFMVSMAMATGAAVCIARYGEHGDYDLWSAVFVVLCVLTVGTALQTQSYLDTTSELHDAIRDCIGPHGGGDAPLFPIPDPMFQNLLEVPNEAEVRPAPRGKAAPPLDRWRGVDLPALPRGVPAGDLY